MWAYIVCSLCENAPTKVLLNERPEHSHNMPTRKQDLSLTVTNCGVSITVRHKKHLEVVMLELTGLCQQGAIHFELQSNTGHWFILMKPVLQNRWRMNPK